MVRTESIALALAVCLSACPAAAQRAGESESVRREQRQLLDSAGGAYEGPVADYVARVGERVAAAAGKPGQCTFTVVNTDVVNAFAAPPGCYVYVTRGLLGIMNSEAELAAALGHEVGHVAANHAGRRRERQALTGLAAVLVGAVAKSDAIGQLAGQAAKLNTLSYSRIQEYEADALALDYLPRAGYAAEGLSNVLDDLQRQDELETRLTGQAAVKAIPAWARTHPLTKDRILRVDGKVAGGPPIQPGDFAADAYLAAIDGLVYGDDPAQGFVDGRVFLHPALRIAFEAPEGFSLMNGARAVGISGPAGFRGAFSVGRAQGGRLDSYAYQVLRDVVGQTSAEFGEPRRTRINGLDAVILPARAQAQSGLAEVVVAAYAVGGDAYHFVTVAPAGRAHAFDPLYGSFRRLTDHEAGRLGPRRIQVVAARAGDTAESLAQRMAVDEGKTERFLMLNALRRDEPLRPGRKLKVVVSTGQ